MTDYRRRTIAGATWFFMVNHIDLLWQVFRKVKRDHPVEIDAMIVLSEHLHCLWT